MPRILIVDDSPTDLQVAGKLLSSAIDCTVLQARDGAEGLEQVESHLPDLVVTDLEMPNMNGLQLVETMRKEFPLIPVVLMTGAGSETIAVQAIEKGAASYVPKTELAADLVDVVQRMLSTASDQRVRRTLLNYLTRVGYVLENDLGLISALVQELRDTLRTLGRLDESSCLRFTTAVDEALQNAYFHGNLEVSSKLREQDAGEYHALADQRRGEEPYCQRRISVELQMNREGVAVTVTDEGPGFDPASLPDPTEPGFLERPCGRGVLLMRSFADEVRFNERGNEVTLLKSATAGDGASINEDA